MVDWSSSMQQTFEYYIVDPKTWKDEKILTTVKSCTIKRDSSAETLGSASISITDSVGECYIRVYLITIQNGVREKHPLGTFLVQTPSSSFDGKIRNVSMDAYTPLLELKENQPPLGYYIPKDDNVMDVAYRLTRNHVRAPVVKTENLTINSFDFVADINDTWLTFISDFIANQIYSDEKIKQYIKTDIEVDINGTEFNGIKTTTGEQVYYGTDDEGKEIYYCIVEESKSVKYKVVWRYKKAITKYKLDIDEIGNILFSPEQEIASLQPVWTYDDSNSSILYPELSMEHDLYGIPNVVEVIYSQGNDHYYAKSVNDNPNSPVSTISRGREITYRVTDPDLVGNPTEDMIKEYADQLLDSLSSPEYTITYTHGYCPVRVGDCIRLNYSRAGLTNIKAKVVSQSIKCEPGTPVTEKAVFTNNLWR